ncbi:MAG TPA: hypothetical protein VHP14_03590, partial [Anaerolineales bacterium]|nr:hypothetical protein [Anaerolineales bacterium]
YVPVAPGSTKSFDDPIDVLEAIETEIFYLPEFYYWDGYTPTAVGCTYGGTFDFNTNTTGMRYLFDLDRCEFIANFKMTGAGSYNTENDRFTLAVKTTGRWTCDLKYSRLGDRVNVTGKCNGKPIKMDRVDPKQRQVPSWNGPQK